MSYKKKRREKRTHTFADIKREVISGPDIKIIKDIFPKSENQELYFDSIDKYPMTFCYGVAGTGKTSLAAYKACKMLAEGKIKTIILTRPMVQTGNGMGFLPGGETEKILPYMAPLLDELESFIAPSIVKQLISLKRIKIAPLETMRGKNYHNCFMILDEAQNCTPKQMELFLSRFGYGSKCVVCGDTRQTDLDYESGLVDAIHRLGSSPFVNFCKMSFEDIQRSPILKDVLGRYES